MNIFKGTIITCDKDDNVYKYLVEDEGEIVFTGNELPDIYKNIDITDLKSKALIPSFCDSHTHFASYAYFASALDIRNINNFNELETEVKKYVSETNNKYIFGFGASENSVEEKILVDRSILDNILNDRPLMLVKYDGHACILNTKMLEKLPKKISKLRGYNRNSGQLFHEAYFAAVDFLSGKVTPLALMRNLQNGIDNLARNGISILHTVEGVGFPLDLDVDLVRFAGRGQKNPFQVRVFFQTLDINKVIKRKLPRIGGCFANALDGCFGSLDAALIQPYTNDSSNKGILFYEDKEIVDFTKKANRAGLQIQLHAIGDAAFKQAVLSLEEALIDFPRDDHRHSIIHACLATDSDLEKCGKSGIAIAAQPSFLHWPLEPFEYIENIIGDRIYNISPYRKMLDMGIRVAGGSDAPCTLPDPIDGIYSVCNHYVPEQSITIQEALKMFTYEGAYLSFDEHNRGSLEVDKIADMVILNKNPLIMDPEKLKELKVEELFLSGKKYKYNQSIPRLIFEGIKGRKKKI
ncbi:MAG: amidohydrolase family protein [Desulfobacterales bacterium]|nr:amidohydrolase family protein [Desulfobacterales bacterium]MCP4163487.1 amidohydrolase family protein [Deltaproteobacteria bacterium]